MTANPSKAAPRKRRYAVLCEATVTHEVVVMADSPEAAVKRAREMPISDWEALYGCGVRIDPIDSVTERRKNGRAFSVKDDGRCVEVEEDLPW